MKQKPKSHWASKEVTSFDPVPNFREVQLEVEDFCLQLRDRKGFLKRGKSARIIKVFWGVDAEDWFYACGSSPSTTSPIELEGWWIRKDLIEFLVSKRAEGWLFYLQV